MSLDATESSPRTALADVTAARHRSVGYGLDASRLHVPHVGDPGPSARALTELSGPVIDELSTRITGSSLALVLADRTARLTRRTAMSTTTRQAMDERSLDVGFSLAERDVGTNGVGTSLETKQPAVVVGDEHYLESFHGFTCANAPIIHPITCKLEGSVGVMCPTADTSALLLPTALQLSAQISELIAEQATPEERFLLEQFLKSRRSPRNAVATIGAGVLIATPSAQRRLVDVDHQELWRHLQSALRKGTQVETIFDTASSEALRLRCRPLHRGGQLEGATVEFVREPKPRNRRRRSTPSETLGDLVGVSTAWQTVVKESVRAGFVDEPVLISGERGTGRCSVAEAIAGERRLGEVEVFSSAEIILAGAQQWLLRFQAALTSGAMIVLRDVDQMPGDVAAAVAFLEARTDAPSILATTQATSSVEPGLDALLRQLNVLHIAIPALRERRSDIAPIARHLLARRGRTHLEPLVADALYRYGWPGNVAELSQVLRTASTTARSETISVSHLPAHVRQANNRMPLHGLRLQEAEAIVAAIESSTTRKEAAEKLGISKATLFRRIKTYGLNPPS